MSITPEQITRHKWWWRLPQSLFTISEKGVTSGNHSFKFKVKGVEHSADVGLFWKGGLEIAAFRYEIARRLKRKELSQSWLEIPDVTAFSIRSLLAETTVYFPVTTGTDPKQVEEQNPNHTEPILFNLDCSDSMLEQSFRDFIAEQRVLTGIKHPKIIRKNSVSWRWLEVWDLNEVDNVTLTPSEHSMKSKAVHLSENLQEKLIQALEHAKKVSMDSSYRTVECVRA
jgi:hypothetical protein